MAIYFLPLSSQKFMILILPTSEEWKAESTLKPPSGFEHRTPQRCFPMDFEKRDSHIGVFLWILKNFKNTFFYRTLRRLLLNDKEKLDINMLNILPWNLAIFSRLFDDISSFLSTNFTCNTRSLKTIFYFFSYFHLQSMKLTRSCSGEWN